MSDGCVAVIVNVALVAVELTADEIATLFLFHWYVGAGTPLAVTENDAPCPFVTITFPGCAEMPGGTITVNVILFVTTPALLLATSEYCPWLDGYCTFETVNVLVPVPE